jgi:predicted transcriptional regulator
MEALSAGATSPEKLDDALEEFLPKRKDKPFTRAFLTTQRAGVVSRLVDLGLIQRVREGTNVTYKMTDKGLEFLKT